MPVLREYRQTTNRLLAGGTMNRMPCSITDGPQYDDNELFPPKPKPDPDYERDMLLDKKFALNTGLGPLITPFKGERHE